MSVYIQSAKQISAQKPLSDEWFDNPIYYNERRVPTINPDFAPHFSGLSARRMCVLLKRAILLSRLTLKEAAVEMPDAIISGTGLGCVDNTENFLHSIMDNGEQFLQPTYFMQSTHNILSSTVAIDMKCHGYNNTFVHRGVSFENALLDAMMQVEQKRAQTVLVGGYDELTDDYYQFFDRIGIWDFVMGDSPKKRCFAGEAAVSMVLSNTRNEQSICEINDVILMHKPIHEQLQEALDAILEKAGCTLSDIDAVVTGLNTHVENDKIYYEAADRLFRGTPVLQYRHLFGESCSSSAIGVYVALTCLHKGYAPAFLSADKEVDISGIKRILVYNHYRNKSHSFILLSSCSN
jgi:3-oxoacyl-(acyl-carrier-protein) synthase